MDLPENEDDKEHLAESVGNQRDEKLYTQSDVEKLLSGAVRQTAAGMEERFDARIAEMYQLFESRLVKALRAAVEQTESKYKLGEEKKE